MGLHLHFENFGAMLSKSTVEDSNTLGDGAVVILEEADCLVWTRQKSRSIHYDIRIDGEVFDEGVTMSARCITGDT
jgi:hypothetical protein